MDFRTDEPTIRGGWWLGLFLSVLLWTCIAGGCIALTACGSVPQRPEEFRVPINTYLTVDLSQRVCSATDGQHTVVWGCR